MSIGKECLALIMRKMSREITPDEYYCALMELDKKYPIRTGISFRQAAEKYVEKRMKKEVRDFKQRAYEPEKEEIPF